jgi:hypothetical protein
MEGWFKSGRDPLPSTDRMAVGSAQQFDEPGFITLRVDRSFELEVDLKSITRLALSEDIPTSLPTIMSKSVPDCTSTSLTMRSNLFTD